MIDVNYDVKLVFCSLCQAMLRNINNNFKSVSFDIFNGNVKVKVVLFQIDDDDESLIKDMMAELSSMSETNNILTAQIETDAGQDYCRYLLYRSSGELPAY
jgi:hypothetical protein